MNADEKLKPCERCGKKPSIGKGGPGDLFWYIACERGNHVVAIQHLGTRAEAIAIWNTRPLENALADALGLLLKAAQSVDCDDTCTPDNCLYCGARAALRKVGR